MTDPLTGLANRRARDHRLAAEWQRTAREMPPLSVLFVDVDYFKRFNDTCGHATGDEVLAAVAERIASATRPRGARPMSSRAMAQKRSW